MKKGLGLMDIFYIGLNNLGPFKYWALNTRTSSLIEAVTDGQVPSKPDNGVKKFFPRLR